MELYIHFPIRLHGGVLGDIFLKFTKEYPELFVSKFTPLNNTTLTPALTAARSSVL